VPKISVRDQHPGRGFVVPLGLELEQIFTLANPRGYFYYNFSGIASANVIIFRVFIIQVAAAVLESVSRASASLGDNVLQKESQGAI
jgi:ABC-type sulfate transport system permease component